MMKNKVSSYLMLGMLHLGASSGYAIKKLADTSTRYFWPTSLAQVYPLLSALEESGQVTRREDPYGGRDRSAYELSDDGRTALQSWLCSFDPKSTHPLFRDEGLLRLFFADSITVEEQLILVRRLRERSTDSESYMRKVVRPIADDMRSGGLKFPAILAELGEDYHQRTTEWLVKLESRLAAEVAVE